MAGRAPGGVWTRLTGPLVECGPGWKGPWWSVDQADRAPGVDEVDRDRETYRDQPAKERQKLRLTQQRKWPLCLPSKRTLERARIYQPGCHSNSKTGC